MPPLKLKGPAPYCIIYNIYISESELDSASSQCTGQNRDNFIREILLYWIAIARSFEQL
jgi:hypothetical protein